jgi:hypothetical protein
VAKWQELAGQGLRLVDYSFVNPPAGVLLDAADVTAGAAGAAGGDGSGGAEAVNGAAVDGVAAGATGAGGRLG